jgi:hypothetical protein
MHLNDLETAAALTGQNPGLIWRGARRKDAAALRAMFDDSTIMSDIRVGMLLRHQQAADVHDQATVGR